MSTSPDLIVGRSFDLVGSFGTNATVAVLTRVEMVLDNVMLTFVQRDLSVLLIARANIRDLSPSRHQRDLNVELDQYGRDVSEAAADDLAARAGWARHGRS